MKPALIVICGPTATGKSELALWVAQRLNSVILGADSRQVYQELDIGTAKPSLEDQGQVPHYLIDLCPPTQTFTVAEYQHQAQALIVDCHARGIVPVLVGGTGLYVQAVVQGLKIPRVPPQPQLRSQLSAIPQVERHQWLQQIDPVGAAKIHGNDAVRTLRSLEVYYTTGIPLSTQQGTHPPTYPILQIGLEIQDKTHHTEHIYQRTQHMLEKGWEAEVTGLIQKYGPELPLLQTLGYAELKPYLSGAISRTEAIDQIVTHTRQFAKRQRTWFRADPTIQWVEATAPHLFQQTWHCIEAFISAIGQD